MTSMKVSNAEQACMIGAVVSVLGCVLLVAGGEWSAAVLTWAGGAVGLAGLVAIFVRDRQTG
jgi:hypothetical protein